MAAELNTCLVICQYSFCCKTTDDFFADLSINLTAILFVKPRKELCLQVILVASIAAVLCGSQFERLPHRHGGVRAFRMACHARRLQRRL